MAAPFPFVRSIWAKWPVVLVCPTARTAALPCAPFGALGYFFMAEWPLCSRNSFAIGFCWCFRRGFCRGFWLRFRHNFYRYQFLCHFDSAIRTLHVDLFLYVRFI